MISTGAMLSDMLSPKLGGQTVCPLTRRPERNGLPNCARLQIDIRVEDGVVKVLHLRGRLDTELVDQLVPQSPEDLERPPLAAASVERRHVLLAQLLVQRILGGQLGQLTQQQMV